jgi:hypothetical protein
MDPGSAPATESYIRDPHTTIRELCILYIHKIDICERVCSLVVTRALVVPEVLCSTLRGIKYIVFKGARRGRVCTSFVLSVIGDILIETPVVTSSISSREFADTVFEGAHRGSVYADFVLSVVGDVLVDSEAPVLTLSSSRGFAGLVFEDAHRDRVYALRYEHLICFVL